MKKFALSALLVSFLVAPFTAFAEYDWTEPPPAEDPVTAVPEMDAGGAVLAATLLGGLILAIRERKSKK